MSFFKNKLRSFWNIGHERTLTIKRNIVYSFFIKAVGISMSFLLIPLTLHYINVSEYGIWVTINSLVLWVNNFDIGLTNGLRNKTAQAYALKENDLIVKYVSTTYAILFLIALLTFVGFYAFGSFFNWNHLLNIKDSIGHDIWLIILITLGSFCIQFFLQPVTAVLIGTHRPSVSSMIFVFGQILTLILTYILTISTKSNLLLLVIVTSASPVVVYGIANIYLFSTSLVSFAPKFSSIDFKSAKSLVSIGGIFFILQIGALVLFETDNIIISRTLGQKEVTTFNLVYKYFSLATVGFFIILTPYWSAITDAYAKRDLDWIKSSVRKMKIIWACISGLAIFLYLLSGPFYKLWLGNTVSIPQPLILSMTIYVIVYNWQCLYVYIINGIGKLRIQLIFIVSAAILNVPLSVLLIKWSGVEGTVIANIVLVIVTSVFYTYQVDKLMSDKATGIWNK